MKAKVFRMLILVLVLALAMVGAACSSNETNTSGQSSTPSEQPSGEESSGTLTINGEQANDHGTAELSGQTETSVEMDDEFYFKPTVLKGTPGQKLSIELENEGSLPHNFSLEAQTISQDVDPGTRQTVSVTFPQSGILEFFCRFHRSSGMIGELTVPSIGVLEASGSLTRAPQCRTSFNRGSAKSSALLGGDTIGLPPDIAPYSNCRRPTRA